MGIYGLNVVSVFSFFPVWYIVTNFRMMAPRKTIWINILFFFPSSFLVFFFFSSPLVQIGKLQS